MAEPPEDKDDKHPVTGLLESYGPWAGLLILAPNVISGVSDAISRLQGAAVKPGTENSSLVTIGVGLLLLLWPSLKSMKIGPIELVRYVQEAKAASESAIAAKAGAEKAKSDAERQAEIVQSKEPINLTPRVVNGAIVNSVEAGIMQRLEAARVDKQNNDPCRGLFGGNNAVNGRKASASVSQIDADGKFFRISMGVESTDVNKPLAGPVYFFLHPTFRQAQFLVTPIAGVATLEVVSWGSFTVGMACDDWQTLLELDLADEKLVPGTSQVFRNK